MIKHSENLLINKKSESKLSDNHQEISDRHYNTKLTLRKKRLNETLLTMKLNSKNYSIRSIHDQLSSIPGIPSDYLHSENDIINLFDNLNFDKIYERYLVSSLNSLVIYGLTLIRQYMLYNEKKCINLIIDKIILCKSSLIEYFFLCLKSSVSQIKVRKINIKIFIN